MPKKEMSDANVVNLERMNRLAQHLVALTADLHPGVPSWRDAYLSTLADMDMERGIKAIDLKA